MIFSFYDILMLVSIQVRTLDNTIFRYSIRNVILYSFTELFIHLVPNVRLLSFIDMPPLPMLSFEKYLESLSRDLGMQERERARERARGKKHFGFFSFCIP